MKPEIYSLPNVVAANIKSGATVSCEPTDLRGNRHPFPAPIVKILINSTEGLYRPHAMLSHAQTKSPALTLPPPDWSAVRPIYQKLSDEFHVLTKPYGVQPDERTTVMLDHLILGIDAIDRVIDTTPSRADRDTIAASILTYLRGDSDTWRCPVESPELQHHVEIIKKIIVEMGVGQRFSAAVEKIFDHTEKKRHVQDSAALIKHVLQEGMSTAELPLSIMQVAATHPFAAFFCRLCMLMGIADLIVDARRDYRLGYIVVRPRLRLYIKLHIVLISEGLRLLWNFPRKWQFLQYCIRFSWSLLRER